jgi:hypothetical protein
VGLVKELTLLWIRGSELCLTIVGTPPWGPCTRECGLLPLAIPRWMCSLALWVAISLIAQSVHGCFPIEAFQVDIVGKMLAKFQEQAEQCLYLKNSGSRVYDLILGLADDQVHPTFCLEEIVGRLQAM